MTLLALILVLLAALIHASWNIFAKHSGGSAAFAWLFASLSCLIYLPVAAIVAILSKPYLGLYQLFFIAISAILHTAYFLLLARGYRTGDLSLVYPLARTSGPILTVGFAVTFMGERPSTIALLGAMAIAIGMFLLIGSPGKLLKKNQGHAVAYAFLTGAVIATYTVTDKYAVSSLAIPPVLLDYLANWGRALLLTPYALMNRDGVRREWETHRRDVLAVAALIPLSYILVLTALQFSLASHVAPAREISILFGTLLGACFLKEGQLQRRIICGAIMILGLTALIVG